MTHYNNAVENMLEQILSYMPEDLKASTNLEDMRYMIMQDYETFLHTNLASLMSEEVQVEYVKMLESKPVSDVIQSFWDNHLENPTAVIAALTTQFIQGYKS